MAEGMLALTWNNHSSTFCKTISSLRAKERYTDVTITCEGKFYQVHKFVLATCSEYFEKIFQETPCKHPVIVLRDVSCDELEALLNYMYVGSVSVAQSDLARLIKVAELFQIKGLAVPDDPPKSSDVDSHGTNSASKDDFENYYRGKAQDSSGSSPRRKENHARSDDDDVAVPRAKRVRSFENASRLQVSNDDQASDPSSVEQVLPFDVQIKEELKDIDSGSEGQDSTTEANYISKDEAVELPENDQSLVEDDSHLGPPYITSVVSKNIPLDEQSLSHSDQEQHSFPDEILSLPGPSDAQEWYSEGDSSGLPVGKGSIGNQSQEMLPVEASQLQSQRVALPNFLGRPRMADGRKAIREKYQCLMCPYSTGKRKDMMKHNAVHTGERPYHCPFCPARFSQNSSMIRHTRVHTGEKPHACSFCNYRASQKFVLKQHILSRHGFNNVTVMQLS